MKAKTFCKKSLSSLLVFAMLLSFFAGITPIMSVAHAAVIPVSASDDLAKMIADLPAGSSAEYTISGPYETAKQIVIDNGKQITFSGDGTIKAKDGCFGAMPENLSGKPSSMILVTGAGSQLTVIDTILDGNESTGVLKARSQSSVILNHATIQKGRLAYETLEGAGVCLGGSEGEHVTLHAYGGTTFYKNVGVTNVSSGGALYVGSTDYAQLEDVAFIDNQAHSGGAIYTYKGLVTCTSQTSFSGNLAGQRGGSIHSHGIVILDGTTVSDSTSNQYGGGIYVSSDGTDSGKGKVILNNATVTGNVAKNTGGGVFVAATAELYIGGSTTVTGNVVRDTADGDITSNIHTSNSSSKIYVYSQLTCNEGQIGISTSNPLDGKHVAWSYDTEDGSSPLLSPGALSYNGYNSGFTMPGYYSMNKDTDMKKFEYDSELFYVAQSTQQTKDMWLKTNEKPSVVFDFNIPGTEASYSPNGDLGTLNVGDTVSVPSVSDQSVGSVTFKFKGWNKEADGSGETLGSTVTVLPGLQIYYAQWDIEDNGTGGGGTGGAAGSVYNVYWDYNFPGQGPGTSVTSGLYGSFDLTYTIHVSTTGGSASSSQTKTLTIAWSVPEKPVREGYTWKGWSTSPTATTGTMNPSAPGQPETFYGVWQANSYTLTWDANGGQGGTTTSQKYDERIVPPTTEPTREGYTFNGWYLDKNCTVPLTSGMTVDGKQTFYASWTSEKVVVNYYDTREGTTLVNTQTYNYGDKFTSLDAMEDTSGQHFIRWQTAGGQAASGITNLVASVPLTYVQGANGSNVSSDAGYWKLDLYAVWQTLTTDYVATINWNDLSNNDGCRPQSIKIGLISSVTDEVVDEATVVGTGNTWTYTFTGLPITTADTSVEKITYSVYMIGYTDCDGNYRAIKDTAASSGEIQGATSSNYDDAVYSVYRYAINNFSTGAAASAYSGEISLDHDLITTRDDIQFSIQWEDESDNDGKRPGAVTLVLYANGVPVQQQPLHNSGTGVASASPSNCTVSGNGDVWTYTFKDYQKYNNGAAITYTVAVKNNDGSTTFNANGYTTTYLNSTNPTIGDTDGAIISRDIELVDKTVKIVWDDESNRDNQRPEDVTVTLTAYQWNNHTFRWEQHVVDTAVIHGDVTLDTWVHTFDNVKKCNGGMDIIYQAAITSDLNAHTPPDANGYTTVSNGLTITASHNRNTKSLPVTVEWDDVQNTDAIRPTTVIFQLYADGVKLDGVEYAALVSGNSTANSWNYTFNNLPVYREGREGEEIVYTFSVEEAVEESIYGTYISTANGEEQEIVRYTASYMDAAGNTTDNLSDSAYPYVKLTHATDQGTVYIYASWHDENNRDGKRPSSIMVDLYKQVDGERTFVQTFTVTAGTDNSWTLKIPNLPLMENGSEITYLAEISDDFRENLQDNYNYTVSMEGSTVHLYYTPAVGFVTGEIHWLDNDNNDGSRPDCVKATLYANGRSTGKTIELNEANDWSYTWQDVASYYNNNGTTGTAVVYSIVVETPDGYSVEYVPATTTTVDPTTIYINLSDETDTISLAANVYWNDNSDQDGKRPDSVKIQLYADGEKVIGKTADLTGDDDIWTYTFTGLPRYNGGKEIDYTIRPADNIARTYDSLTAGMNLYLAYDASVADMTVSFRFNDSNNADGVRPEALYLTLTANGVPVEGADYQRTVYFDVDGQTWTFADLPVYSTDGEKIKYNATVELSDEFGSTDYTISVSRDITLSTTNSNSNQVIVSLSKESATGVETGHVYWFDNNNQRGNRPTILSINLYSDAASYVVGTYTLDSVTGKVTDASGNEVGSVTVSEWGDDGSSCWTYTISGLTQNAVYDGVAHEIYYYSTARTTGIANWYNVIDGQANGMDVNLTHKNYLDDIGSSQQNFAITVSWLDNDNAWNYRPNTTGTDITLYANGTEYKTIHLTRSNVVAENTNAWTYTFVDLPTYLNGSAVVWTAAIGDVNKYTAVVSNHSDYATITMTQSIGFDFTLNWSDSDDDDAARPDSVTVEVYGDGTKVGEVILTGGGNKWTAAIKDLAVWRTTGTTVPVSYSFRWSEATGAELIDNYYNASATKNGTPVEADTWYYLSATEWGSITGGLDDLTNQYQWETTLQRDKETKTVYADILWDDDANRDGLRPASVMVQLYANGAPCGTAKSVTGESTESSWPVSWELQDVYDGGAPIVYTAAVVSVPDSYSESVDATGTQITLTHVPETVDVIGTVIWDDASELHYVYNSVGDLIKTYEEIQRVPVYLQLYLNGEPYGEPIRISSNSYGMPGNGELDKTASYTWPNVYVYENEGETNEYTFKVYSDALDALLNDGHSQAYDFSEAYAPSTTITHTLYDVRGSVHYLYDTSDDFILEGVKVTAYLYDDATQTYTAVGSALTDANGRYEILNVPQGMLTIRATYAYGDYTYAGSKGVQLDRHDATVDLIVDRDATADSDLYRYEGSGYAFYQTDKTDSNTIHAVPAGSVVLLYKITDTIENAEYMAMTTTDASGRYSFAKLADGNYIVNVVFNYDDGTYTYDNADAVRDGLHFNVTGSDIQWNNIIKQVNAIVDPNPPTDPEEPVIPEPEPEPEPCVVDGAVYFSDNGVHTTDPVENVDVYIYAAENNALVGSTATDENGLWTVDDLAAGQYIGVFSYAGNASRVLRFSISNADYERGTYTAATQYFDRQSDASTATIRGVVLDENGNQISGLVQILDESGNLVNIGYTDKNGYYEFTVRSGYTYEVKILSVDTEISYLTSGDPDDELTTLDYYTISGNFSINGTAQSGATVALYKEDEYGVFRLLTATLTNTSGDYTLKVTDGGNYRVTMYRNGTAYDNHYVSVGYQEYEPVVADRGNGLYNISGFMPEGAFDSATLYNTTTNVIRVEAELGQNTGYSFDVSAGTYQLDLVKNGVTTTYYIDAPDSVLSVKYYVTVSGSVLDNSGNPVLGSIVTLLDSNGNQVGEQTIITNGTYSYANLPAGEYTVQVEKPVAATELVDKTTEETDSYGNAYPDGMTPGSTWSWNINAVNVSGTVKDQNGEPISGATVVLKLNNAPDKAYAILTDENGNWTLGVMNGNYTASAMFEFDIDHIYNATETLPVLVNGVDINNVGFTINRYTMTGSVVRDGDNAALKNANVTITYADGTVAWTGTTDETGSYSAVLYPDSYKVSVEYNGVTAGKDVTMDADKGLTIPVSIPIQITGTVYDVDGQTPVADGIVHYSGPVSGMVYTNDDGTYSIPLTAAQLGNYTLYADAAGSSSARIPVTVTTDTVQNLTLGRAEGEHMVSGVVIDNEGNRLANAYVTVLYGNDKTELVSTSTNSNGEYRVFLQDGTYYLTAYWESANGYTYYTNGETAAHVDGADKTNANLTISLSYDVTVYVVDTEGNAVPGATIRYTGAGNGTATSDEDGEAVIKLAGGEYAFKATIGNRASNTVNVNISHADDVTLVVEQTGIAYEKPDVESTDYTISGNVIDPNGNPVENATVTLYKFNLVTEEWDVVDTDLTDADGYYEFTGLEDGRYRVDYNYTLTSDSIPTETGYFVINGYATDESSNPYIAATVNLYNQRGQMLNTTFTNGSGYYEFSNVPEGNQYTVEIIPAPSDNANTIVLDNVSTTPGNAVIAGTVVDINGEPVEGATVVVSNGGNEWRMVTEADGIYSFEVPSAGNYNVTITYPVSYRVDTDSYTNDFGDPIAPVLNADSFIISGYVHDTDDNVIVGATVKLLDNQGNELRSTTTNSSGYYEFTNLDPGDYTVVVEYNARSQEYVVTANGDNPNGSTDDPNPPVSMIDVSGVVVTDHRTPLAGAAIEVRNTDTDETVTIYADSDGRFNTGDLARGRYELIASYTHAYGTNESEPLYFTRTQTDAALVIVLSYVDDVNGDGRNETVYAGVDDAFDTSDDFYQSDVDGNGTKENIYAGEDGQIGTKDDQYSYDVDNDGEEETVYVGEDRIPGTEDDYYLYDVDKDGQKDDKIFAGADKLCGTEDDYYLADPDKDGAPEQIFVGEDTIPGTNDDWYLSDPDADGENEQVFVGEDGKPGTDDDWYEDGGEELPVGDVYVNFNGNSGKVNGMSIYKVLKDNVSVLPDASRTNFTFDGWFTAPTGGTQLTLSDILAFTRTTTVYAHWTANAPDPITPPGGGGGGGGSIGGGGGGGAIVVPPVEPIEPEEPEVPAVLTKDHIAYIIGSPDGLVHPEANITRAEVAMIFYRLLTPEAKAQYETSSCSYSDVSANAWYGTAVATLSNMGIITGASDGKFHPNDNITRAELATIAARFDENIYTGANKFNDINGHWAAEYINRAAERGWVNGTGNGAFQPNRTISRAEVMTLVNNVLGRSTITEDSLLNDMIKWPDNMDTNKWYYLAVQEATNGHMSSFESGHEVWTALQ